MAKSIHSGRHHLEKNYKNKFHKWFAFKPKGDLSHKWKFYLSIIFAFFVAVEASFLYMQFGEIVKKKSAKDISLIAFFTLCFTNIIWIIYAVVVVGSTPILLSGILYVIGSSLIIIATLIYGDGKKDEE